MLQELSLSTQLTDSPAEKAASLDLVTSLTFGDITSDFTLLVLGDVSGLSSFEKPDRAFWTDLDAGFLADFGPHEGFEAGFFLFCGN